MKQIPFLPGRPRKNDALFIYGASKPKPYVVLYNQLTVEVVHGPSCRAPSEIILDNCRKDGVSVSERRGGGGTVVLSPGMLITVIVGERKRKDGALDIFERIHGIYADVLKKAGVPDVRLKGISDLAIGERKIMGSSLYMGTKPFYYYYQSCLMVSPDHSLLDRYLLHPPREPDYRKGRSHREFCTSLREQNCSIDQDELSAMLGSALGEQLASKTTPPSSLPQRL
ncbi:MAG: biotin/lipoate A/B protein ligase family protein [Chitinispirillaceae bacterium]